MIRLCFFDLDGTLLSTLDTIRYHLNNTLLHFGLKEISPDECRSFIGNGARKLVMRSAEKSGLTDPDAVGAVLDMYNSSYDANPIPNTFIYPGVAELVDELYRGGYKLAVLTNKPHQTAVKLIEHFFPGKFDCIMGGGGAPLKPDPSTALAIAESLGCSASECAFVGDSSVDIMTGKNMGAMASIGVLWGFRTKEELLMSGADHIAERAEDILKFLMPAEP